MVIHRVFDEVFRTWSNVAVLRALLDTNTGFSGNEVARVAGMNPRSAFKALTSLEELGIVNRQIGGRDHLFSLNREHFLVQEVVLKIYPVENKFPTEIINTLASILKKRVHSALLFGSAARKEEKPLSDLDLCCIVNSAADRILVSDLLDKRAPMLYKRYGVKLAPIYFLKAEFVKKRNSKLIKDIIKEGILVTGKNVKGIFNG